MTDRLCILVDIDDVCNNLMETTLEFFNRENVTSYVLEDFTDYGIHNCISEEDANKMHQLFLRKDLWEAVRPTRDAQMTLKQMLNDGHEVYLCTATHYANASWKGEWLAKYFSFFPWENVFIGAHKEKIDAHYLIDDNLDHLKKRPYGRVCITRPWNQHIRDDVYDIIRVNSLGEAYKAILQREEEREWGEE